jgi:sialidase-1
MTRKSRVVTLLAAMSIAWAGAAARAQAFFQKTDVFVGGQDNINTYRIPSLICTKKGTVLAFSEGRKDSSMDGSPTDLVLKRSLGNADPWHPVGSWYRSRQTDMMWQPMQTLIHSQHGEAYMNPVPLIDRSDGAIFLLVNLYPQPYKDLPADILLLKSTDEGATWSSPVDITRGTGKRELGPGDGIQLRSGRLMAPVYNGVIFSDDHGRTWKSSAIAAGAVNETQVVELVDGRLELSRRNPPYRLRMISHDEGQTWGEPVMDTNLPDIGCQGSLIRYTRKNEGFAKSRLLFSNPVGPGRSNLTVRMSYDEGKSWPVAKVIRNGPGAYSSMTVFPDGSIGILYETGGTYNGVVDLYGKLVFARFNLGWLTDGKDHLEKRE